MNSTYFALRSNAGWFKNQDSIQNLVSQIKFALVCYDKVIFQDGTYFLDSTDTGTVGLMANGLDETERQHSFGEGGNFSLKIGLPEKSIPMQTVISGKAKSSYKADFLPILKESGFLDEEYVHWTSKDYGEQIKEGIANLVKNDRQNADLTKLIKGQSFEKGYIIESYYIDIIIASKLKSMITFDRRIQSFIEAKNKTIVNKLLPDVTSPIFDSALNLDMPDYSQLSWDDVYKVRNSVAGQSFRDMIVTVRQTVLQELPNIKDKRDLTEETNKLFTKELFNEMSEFLPTSKSVSLGLIPSLISLAAPIAGFFGNANDLNKLIEKNNSWISLIDTSINP